VNLTVTFATGSAELTLQATQALESLGTALSDTRLSGYRFRVEGHTDTVGTREYNQALSERRAETVVAYITARFQVDPGRLQPVGLGMEHLLVPTPDQTAELRNRRVHVINLGG
jgi:outer membrane protein OmpA-like peptidoglycan-associated protein